MTLLRFELRGNPQNVCVFIAGTAYITGYSYDLEQSDAWTMMRLSVPSLPDDFDAAIAHYNHMHGLDK